MPWSLHAEPVVTKVLHVVNIISQVSECMQYGPELLYRRPESGGARILRISFIYFLCLIFEMYTLHD